jgi:hypothetical protein
MVRGTSVTRRTLALVLATAAVGGLAVLSMVYADVSKAVPTCPDGNACVWTNAWYDGSRHTYSAGIGHDWVYATNRGSAKNRFNNRPFRLMIGDDKMCLDPGENNPTWPFEWVRVGLQGQRC